MKICNKQIYNGAKTTVVMKSGKRVKLGRCILRPGHYSKCGWIGYE